MAGQSVQDKKKRQSTEHENCCMTLTKNVTKKYNEQVGKQNYNQVLSDTHIFS